MMDLRPASSRSCNPVQRRGKLLNHTAGRLWTTGRLPMFVHGRERAHITPFGRNVLTAVYQAERPKVSSKLLVRNAVFKGASQIYTFVGAGGGPGYVSHHAKDALHKRWPVSQLQQRHANVRLLHRLLTGPACI